MIITTNEPKSVVGYAFAGALRGVSTHAEVRFMAPVNAPATGEVRPQAGNVATSHFGNGIKDGVCVRIWGPPV